MKRILIVLAVLLLSVSMAFASGGKETSGADAKAAGSAPVSLNGAGATFPQPLYTVMFDEYAKATGNKVNYQGVGSGAGIKQLTEKTVDFGASDAPMKQKEMEAAGAEVLHIPTCIGAIVLTYNLPTVKARLKFDSDTIADIFLGKITKWNDPAIVALNPGVSLPDLAIGVVHRSDSSGTSFNFTTYLTKVNKEWADKVGASKSPDWPTGIGGQGNPGVASSVKQVPGALGYVEIAYARQNDMPVAQIKNAAGNFIDPGDLDNVALAADVDFPADAKVDVVNSPAAKGYPIAATTWLLLYKDQTYTGKMDISKGVVELMWWMLHDGQKLAESVNYAPLPPAAIKVAENLLKSVTYDGKALLQ
ncbi:MAG: phosphate ABC transporter substrate-binding protein PstS [Spirochaetales bacterium]|nr:phosphate ABC transporter substrate-binding protein PstS [Spirochaetales bacterium]